MEYRPNMARRRACVPVLHSAGKTRDCAGQSQRTHETGERVEGTKSIWISFLPESGWRGDWTRRDIRAARSQPLPTVLLGDSRGETSPSSSPRSDGTKRAAIHDLAKRCRRGGLLKAMSRRCSQTRDDN